jgi:hypothetical protein
VAFRSQVYATRVAATSYANRRDEAKESAHLVGEWDLSGHVKLFPAKADGAISSPLMPN